MKYNSTVLVERAIKDSFSISSLIENGFDRPSTYRLVYNRIFLIDSGSGQMKIDGDTFEISSPQILLAAKGQVISIQADTAIEGYELSFGDCFWERAPTSASNCKAALFNNVSANQRLFTDEENHKELDKLFHTLLNEFTGEEYKNKLDAMAAYLKIIMIKIANINTSIIKGFDSYENKIYMQFLELISRNYQNSRGVTYYAGQLGVSSRKLSDLSKYFSGLNAKELISEQLIAEAKRSLQFSSKPVKEIAFQLNFSTPDQFSHFFKKNALLSPQNYRALFVNLGA